MYSMCYPKWHYISVVIVRSATDVPTVLGVSEKIFDTFAVVRFWILKQIVFYFLAGQMT